MLFVSLAFGVRVALLVGGEESNGLAGGWDRDVARRGKGRDMVGGPDGRESC